MTASRHSSRVFMFVRSGLFLLLSATVLFSTTDSSTLNVTLWRNTLLLSLVSVAWYWFRKRQTPDQLTILYSALCIIASTAITQLALAAAQNPGSIHSLPDLTPFYLSFHYALVLWLILRHRQPSIFRLPAVWPMLILYSSYLYFHTFFALELGTPYPILFALILGHLLLRPITIAPTIRNSQIPIRNSLFVFLLLAGLATAMSAAPGESLPQYLQIAFFAFLPFLLVYDLVDARTWRYAVIWVAVMGGLIFVVLAVAKFGVLTLELGFVSALRYRLLITDIGPNWISRPLVTLLPLCIGIMFIATSRPRKLLWAAGILGMLLTIAYTQSSVGYSGWIALVLGVATMVLLLQWFAIKEWWQRHTRGRLIAIAIGLVLMVTMGLIGGSMASRINGFSLYTRLYNWVVSLYQVADNLWFGIGLNVRHVQALYSANVNWLDIASWLDGFLPYYELSQQAQQGQLINHTHSLFLELAVGTGIPALLVFLWFLWALAKHSLATFRHATRESRFLIAGCIAGIMASLGWGLIDVMEFSPLFFTTPTWVLIGLLLAAPRAFNIDERRRSADKVSPLVLRLSSVVSFFSADVSLFSALIPSRVSRFIFYTFSICLTFVTVVVPMFGNRHYRTAYTAYQEHRWSLAIDELTHASRWEPFNAKYHQLRGEALINLGQYTQAISAYECALRLKQGYAPYHAQLGWLTWLQGDLEVASTHFQMAVEMDPHEAWRDGLHADLALTYMAQDQVGEAISLFKQTIEMDYQMATAPYWVPMQRDDGSFDVVLDSAYLPSPNSGRGIEGEGVLRDRILTHLGKADYTPRLFAPATGMQGLLSFKTVLNAIEEDYAAAREGGSWEASGLLATVAEAAQLVGLHKRAEKAFLAYQEAYPHSAYGFRELGNLYREQGRFAEAQKMMIQALKVSPDDISSWFGFARVYMKQGKWEEVDGALDTIYRLAPLKSTLYSLRAQLYRAQVDLIRSAETMHQSLFIKESIPNRLTLADLYRQLEQPQPAAEQCTHAADALLGTWPRPLDPRLWDIAVCFAKSNIYPQFTIDNSQFTIHNLLLGHYFRAQGQFDQALTAYQAAADFRPDEGAPHFFLGETYQALGQLQTAAAEYRQAAQLDPFESLPLLALGQMQWQSPELAEGSQGHREAALETFRAAVEVTPGWGEVHVALGNALLVSGDSEDAADHYRLAQIADGSIQEGVVYDFTANLAEADIKSPSPDFVLNDYFIIDGDQQQVLFAHPDSRIHYTVHVPEAALLTFNLATAPESWQQPGDGVDFAVYVESSDGEHQLFSTYIDPKNNKADRRWHPNTIDLSAYVGQTVTIIYETGSGPSEDFRYDWAGWGEPRLVAP